jgi:hypothetical protein
MCLVGGALILGASAEKPCRITCGENENGDITTKHGLLSSALLGVANALSFWHSPMTHRCFLDEDGVCVCVCDDPEGGSSTSATVPEDAPFAQPFFNPVRHVLATLAVLFLMLLFI